MTTIDRQLEQVLATSRHDFERFRRLFPKGDARKLSFAAQAAECLAGVKALGVSRTDPRTFPGMGGNTVADVCRQGEKNIDKVAGFDVCRVNQAWRDIADALRSA